MDEAERMHPSRTLSNRSLTRPQPGRRPSCPTCRAKLTSDILVVPNYSLQHTIEKYVAAQKILAEQLPIIPMFYEKYLFITSEKVADLPSSQGSPVWSQVSVK